MSNPSPTKFLLLLRDHPLRLLWQVITYGGVGVAALAVDNAVFYVLRVTEIIEIAPSVIAARTVGAVFAFFGNRSLTFRHIAGEGSAWKAEAVRYAALTLFSMAMVTALVWTFTRGLMQVDSPVYETAIKVMADILAFAWNFALSRLWVFRRSNA